MRIVEARRDHDHADSRADHTPRRLNLKPVARVVACDRELEARAAGVTHGEPRVASFSRTAPPKAVTEIGRVA